jgi:hypothetical protein
VSEWVDMSIRGLLLQWASRACVKQQSPTHSLGHIWQHHRFLHCWCVMSFKVLPTWVLKTNISTIWNYISTVYHAHTNDSNILKAQATNTTETCCQIWPSEWVGDCCLTQAILAHCNNSPRIDMSTHSDTLSWFWATQSFSFCLILRAYRKSHKYKLYSLCVDPIRARTHDLLHSRGAR